MVLQERVITEIDKLRDNDFTNLSRIEEFGTQYNFQEAARFLEDIYKDLTSLETNIESLRVTNKKQDQIFSIAQQANQLVEEIKNFTLKGNESNAPSQHENIHNRVRDLYEQDLEIIVPLLERIDFLKIKPLELDSELVHAKKVNEELKKVLNIATKDKENLDATLKGIRDSLGKEGSTFSADDFQKQAEEHKTAAGRWLAMIIVSIIIFIAVALTLYFHGEFNLQDAQNNYARIVQVAIFKVVILSLSYLLVHQSIKNYKVNNHLYVLNRHRQLALQVYPLMTGASTSPEHSNIILGNAAKAIFDQNSTGYLDGSDDNPNPINLTEVVNKFVDKAGK